MTDSADDDAETDGGCTISRFKPKPRVVEAEHAVFATNMLLAALIIELVDNRVLERDSVLDLLEDTEKVLVDTAPEGPDGPERIAAFRQRHKNLRLSLTSPPSLLNR